MTICRAVYAADVADWALFDGDVADGVRLAEELRNGRQRDECRVLLSKYTLVYWTITGLAGATEVHLRCWEAGSRRWASGARKLCKTLRGYTRVFPLGEPITLLMDGWRCWLQGKRGRAEKAWRRSIERAEHLGLPHEAARARLELARRLPDLVDADALRASGEAALSELGVLA